MVDIEVIHTTSAHLRLISTALRPEDEAEILAFGYSPSKALWRSYKGSIIGKTAFIDGHIAAVWGCAGTFMGTTGQPWLLTTQWVTEISPLRFARIYQQEVEAMLKLFPKLVSYVDASYTSAVRLLDIIGFDIGEPEPKGRGMYRRFEMKGGVA